MRKKTWMGLLPFVMAGIILLVCLIQGNGDKRVFLTYPEFWDMAESGQVRLVQIGDEANWRAELTDGTRVTTPNPRAQDAKERLLAMEITVEETGGAAPGWLFACIALGAVAAFAVFQKKGAVGLQKYAAVQADERVPKITFEDVAVPAETLQSMRDLVSFLVRPGSYRQYGARVPKGVLLYGPPGTGKTLLARALAGEAKAPFFAMSGADFVQVYVGVGASRVRELFRKARKAGGGVIFIDEIDAIGKKRDNGNDEREQTLNALLTEMSGFSSSDGIIVLAATNRLDTLDPALLREGRFDRRIEIGLPDYDQRLKILQVHAKSKPLEDMDYAYWARQTAMFSGAQLETFLNEAAIRAARRSAGAIQRRDLETAFCAVTVGDESPRRMTKEEKRLTAWHEAGHALVTARMLPDTRVTRVTIIPSVRGAAGYSMSVQPDRLMHTRVQLMGMVCAALAGRAAEEMLAGRDNVTTGAADDLKKARQIARAMAEDFSMGDTGDGKRDEETILKEAMEKTRACLRAYGKTLQKTAETLMEKETLGEEELARLLAE